MKPMAIPQVPKPQTRNGLALVLVLWVLVLMTIMAGSYALSTQREAALLNHAHERAKGLALAEGGVNYAMMMLSLPDPTLRWRADGSDYLWEMEGARVRIRIFDEAGKVDLNAAQEPTLRKVLNYVVHNEEQAVQLADAILDWRDPDDLKLMHGAEAADYRAAGSNQRPQNRHFLVLEELRGVLGITPDLYHRLQDWFTVHSRQDGLNPSKASKEILLALADGNAGLVENYLAQRRAGTPPPFPPVPGINYNSAADGAYTIWAMAEFADQPGVGVRAIVKRGGTAGSAFTYLGWRPRMAPAGPVETGP